MNKLDKGHLQVADRVLDGRFINIKQWERDCKAAKELGLVEWERDVDGWYPTPTQRYIDLMDQFS